MKLNIRKLIIHKDSRGWLSEILRPEDVGNTLFGQVLVSTALPGQIKGEHYHKRKKEWYCVVRGNGLLRVTDRKTGETETLRMGEDNMITVEIPTGYMHSIKNIDTTEMILIAYTSEPFDPADPDVYTE